MGHPIPANANRTAVAANQYRRQNNTSATPHRPDNGPQHTTSRRFAQVTLRAIDTPSIDRPDDGRCGIRLRGPSFPPIPPGACHVGPPAQHHRQPPPHRSLPAGAVQTVMTGKTSLMLDRPRYAPFDGRSSARGEDLPMTTPQQPGWYDDPHAANAQRYWDGQDWTPHRQRKPTSAPTPPPVMPTQPPPAMPTPVMPTQPPAMPTQLPPPPPVMPTPVMPTQPPAVALGAQQQKMPNNHLVWAVFSFLGCFPLGLIAIINATKVSNLWALGQYDAARAASKSARNFAFWATIAWAVVWGGSFFLFVVLPLFAIGTSTSP